MYTLCLSDDGSVLLFISLSYRAYIFLSSYVPISLASCVC